MRRTIVLLPLASLLPACEIFAPGDCPLSAEPAIEVYITDATTGAPRAADASGFVRDGAFTDSLSASTFNGDDVMTSRRAADERPGLYDITIQHPGYHTWTREDVRVRDGECNVQTREIAARLTPVGGF